MTNREEVAKKIRRIDEYDCYEMAIYEIDTIIGTEKSPLFSDFLNRLADLIDPTCEITLDKELSQEVQDDMFRCNKCNAAFPRINGEYRYCPHCGARVVRDDG